MKLNHMHLAGPDVKALQAFYETFFGFREKFQAETLTFLENEDGFLLALDPVSEPATYPSWFHLGFLLDGPVPVRELYARMQKGGATIARELMDVEGEYAVFFCADPGGTKIEVSWRAG